MIIVGKIFARIHLNCIFESFYRAMLWRSRKKVTSDVDCKGDWRNDTNFYKLKVNFSSVWQQSNDAFACADIQQKAYSKIVRFFLLSFGFARDNNLNKNKTVLHMQHERLAFRLEKRKFFKKYVHFLGILSMTTETHSNCRMRTIKILRFFLTYSNASAYSNTEM